MFKFDHSLKDSTEAIGLKTGESVMLTVRNWTMEEDMEDTSRMIERITTHPTLNKDEKLWAMYCFGQILGTMNALSMMSDELCENSS